MRTAGILLIALSLLAFGKDVPQHYTLDNPPMGWTASDQGLYKGDVNDANALAVIIQYREFNNPMTEDQMCKTINKTVSTQYGKLKDIGPASVAGHATERYEVTDLGGVIHRIYVITQTPSKVWLVEVRGRQTQVSSAEAEIELILGRLKLQ
jgi:hypothetical protein